MLYYFYRWIRCNRKKIIFFSYLSGSGEKNSTLNQLLLEMDGLGKSKENVIVIEAIHPGDNILDKACLELEDLIEKLLLINKI